MMASRRVRLKDVSAKTGFSINTVSLALRGSPRVQHQTREVIVETARRLNYVPNAIARSLVERSTRTVGVVLSTITNPILTLSARHLERALSERGYGMLLAVTDRDLEKERRVLDLMLSRQVDGILIYPVRHGDIAPIKQLRSTGLPVVLLAGHADQGIDLVTIDNTKGARQAVRHLLGAGHRRIGFVDAGRGIGTTEKFEGYAQALRDHRLAADPRLVIDPGGFGPQEGYDAAAALMAQRRPPTALFCSTDLIALGAIRWALDHGLRVPDELAVVGFDDIESAGYASVPLTTVAYPADRVSAMAVSHLLSLVEAKGALPEARSFVIEPELVVRQSSGQHQSATSQGGKNDASAGQCDPTAAVDGSRNHSQRAGGIGR